jgi:hypothetical protein
LVAGIWVYVVHQAPGVDLVRLQWSAGLTDKTLAGIRQHSAQFQSALDWDMRALMPGYWVGLLLACYLGWRVFWTSRSRACAVVGMAAAVLAAACNLAQDLLLLKALSDGLRKAALLDWIEALSFAKFAALLVAGVVGIVAIMVTTGRLTTSNRTKKRWQDAIGKCRDGNCLVIPPPVIEHPAQEGRNAPRWRLSGQEWGTASRGGRAHGGRRVLLRHRRGSRTLSASACRAGGSVRLPSLWAHCTPCVKQASWARRITWCRCPAAAMRLVASSWP